MYSFLMTEFRSDVSSNRWSRTNQSYRACALNIALAISGLPANAATIDLIGTDTEIADLAGNDTITNSGPGDAAVVVTGSASTTFSGTIADGSAQTGLTLRKDTNSTGLTLTGTNSYSGDTTLEAGELSFGSAASLGSGSVILAGGDLRSLSTAILANRLTFGAAAGSLIADDGTTLTLTGTYENFGNAVFGEAGNSGTIDLAASSFVVPSFSTATIAGGTVRTANAQNGASAFSMGAGVTIEADGTLEMDGFDVNVTDLAGSGTIVNSAPVAAVLTESGTDSTEFSGAIAGGAAPVNFTLNKTDINDTLTLSGQNSFGDTRILRGTLRTSGTTELGDTFVGAEGALMMDRGANAGSIQTNGALVASGGNSFSGNVSIGAGGSLTIVDGAVAGNVANRGLLTASGQTTFSGDVSIDGVFNVGAGLTTIGGDLSTGLLSFEFGGITDGTFARLDIADDLFIGGVIDFDIVAGLTLGKGQLFDIITVGGGVLGQFAGLGEGALIEGFSEDVFITYKAGDGNDIALFTSDGPPAHVPLPASVPVLLTGLGALAWIGRRRSQTF
ncbi:VPLPA-CTERM sorting domain-containing protein [Sulfitobacter sp. D35]|uniref:VPLPA-CTERM sorting domain-containing protein n=1 Tax=Sulfitobacter sp. D35 TaxID=3083252 RepID=UPI00296F9B21|nr:VPLPA-CTERM sorting domain-containing protein [Sulfitobacter sp. D35]MDW4500562.1 VPLPA-CTERM sorting domain-containing protein [Sulfitobacter sp. D35]